VKDRQTERQTERQTDRQTNRKTDRQTDRQTDTPMALTTVHFESSTTHAKYNTPRLTEHK